ncbi:MAG TPA: alkaline phosphatase family protein, partial [Pseudonocardiaceae bacterium]|nr:alkaline phosphatase family protein [Pseudonocardiaceae bacterium]
MTAALVVVLAAAATTNQPVTPARAASVPAYDHVFVVVMENHGYSSIIGSSAAPYVNSLLPSAALAANYYAVTHPSLPNYLALAGGSMFGITSDCTTCWISATNIADRLEAAGSTWKGYMESMPSPCFIGDSYPYAQKHNPFIYFNDIRTNAVRCQSHVVPYSQLATDLASTATTPNFAFITPNMCSDTHDCTVGAGDSWLSVQVPSILNSAAFKTQRSLLLLTWDEDDSTGANQVATVLLGSGVAAGGRSSVAYNHYSLLRTIEDARGLTTLTANDANAAPMTDLFATAPPPSPSPSPSPSPTPPPKSGVCSVVAISALPAAPSVAGAQVAATAAAGGCPTPRYEFWTRSSSGPWQMVQAYSG